MDKDPAIEQFFLELWNDCYMPSGLCTWSSPDKTPQKRFPVVICSWNSLFLCFLKPDIFPKLQNKLNVFHLIFLAFPWNKTQNKISASYIKDGSVIILSFFFPHSQFTVCLKKKKKSVIHVIFLHKIALILLRKTKQTKGKSSNIFFEDLLANIHWKKNITSSSYLVAH